ncbi:MAG: hypothetical protein HKO80_08165 [Flavobacteriaceae bacterium]|nr:hypothetical protein [Flavobacteriaceae bacterium]
MLENNIFDKFPVVIDMRYYKFEHKLWFTLILVVLIFSCKSDIEPDSSLEEAGQYERTKLTSKDVQTIDYTEYVLSNAADRATKDWQKFQELNLQIELLKKANLSFFKDDKAILLSFINDLKNEIPESLDRPSIVVRMIALETVLYKLEGTANLNDVKKEELLESIKAVLVAHTNLIFQINKTLEKEAQKIKRPL